MLNHLLDVSVRSLGVAALAAVSLGLYGRRRTAALQHAMWTAVLFSMLALFVFGATLPKLPLRVLAADAARSVSVESTYVARVELPVETATPMPAASTASRRWTLSWSEVALAAYAALVIALFARLLTGVFLVRRLMARSSAAGEFFESELVTVPFTVGWLQPRIVLPMNWRDWPADKLNAVLAHELAHVRRRDGLFTLVAGINRCIFWFHPLSWFVEQKLALLAEEACDEACVAELGDRNGYARLLVEMASVIDGSQKRLQYHALTMAAPTHLRRRIDSLLAEGRTFSRGVSRPALTAVAVCALPVLLIAGGVELAKRPVALQLEIPRWTVPQPPPVFLTPKTPVLVAQAIGPQLQAPVGTAPLRFDSVIIKRCETGEGDGVGTGGRGGAVGRPFVVEPGTLAIHCMPLTAMVQLAAAVNDALPPAIPNAIWSPLGELIRGGPEWAATELYTVEARTRDPRANATRISDNPEWNAAVHLMEGPMLLAVLQDRFQLRVRKEGEMVPIYALTVAPAGAKLRPAKQADCPFINGEQPADLARCEVATWGAHGPNFKFGGTAMPLSGFATLASMFLDRPVQDQTGITGRFKVVVEYQPDEHFPKMPTGWHPLDPTSSIPKAPPIFQAIEEQLGLRLERAQGPNMHVVIDGAERPAVN